MNEKIIEITEETHPELYALSVEALEEIRFRKGSGEAMTKEQEIVDRLRSVTRTPLANGECYVSPTAKELEAADLIEKLLKERGDLHQPLKDAAPANKPLEEKSPSCNETP